MLVRNFSGGPVWLPGSITGLRGTLTYDVKLDDGRCMRRHLDHLRVRPTSANDELPSEESNLSKDDFIVTPPFVPTEDKHAGPAPSAPELRRLSRPHRPPDRYGL